jgi:hypothetical protein
MEWDDVFHMSQDKIMPAFLMAYSKAKLKSSGDRASCFRPFWIGKL